MDENLPIIVGVGQVTQRPETERPREPLALMADAARLAEVDAHAGDLLHALDSIRVVNIMSWPSRAPAHDLAQALAVAPREQLYTHIGGNTPQGQVNEAAERIHDGELKLVLIAGAEAMYSARRARTKQVDLGWTPRGTPVADVGDPRSGVTATEATHGAALPTQVYPLFENALRAHYGRSVDDHRSTLGELFAPFSSVASANEHAWFRDAKSAREIATPSAVNRYIGYPYTKYMNAIIDVDQGAALLMTSVAEARRLRIPEERWVYVRGCGDATDHWYVSDRVHYHTSPAIRASGARALGMAGATIDDITHFDLYSCFPSAVEITRDMLGIRPNDPRPLTVTGGLPYFGGPGNNYVMHSIAAMAERLRTDRGTLGLVTANGWYLTKHATGIYSTTPSMDGWRRTDPNADQAAIDAEPAPEVVAEPAGDATIETYTVLFDRDGVPERGIVIGRTGDARRFIANTPAGRTLEAMTTHEMIGTTGVVSRAAGGETNLFVPA